MLRNIIFYFLVLIQFINFAQAKIDVVYPTQKNTTINAPSVYFMGNTDKGADFFINSESVKLWDNNFFVHVIPLKYGKNEIKLTSKYNNNSESVIYTITRNKPLAQPAVKSEFIQKSPDSVLYSKTINDRATVREKPSKASNRVIDLQKNVVLYLTGHKGDYYKIDENSIKEFWIHKSNIIDPIQMQKKMNPTLKKIKHYSDENYDYSKFYLSHPVMYTLNQNANSIKLTLYGIIQEDKDGSKKTNYEHNFGYDSPIQGYDGYYEDGNFIFKKAKLPEFDVNSPLKNVKIFVDAGHGGSEKGSVGPTRINEKDINLAISKYLINYLQSDGAKVSYSRIDDTKVSLYDRVKKAKDNNAMISISIHNNALPSGKDPYMLHGTEVHYYNENAKKLAEIIQKNLVKDLNLKDNGVHKSSFALNRSTNPVSVLVEIAYMINPEEYLKLQEEEFQKKAALSIKKSLENYMISINTK